MIKFNKQRILFTLFVITGLAAGLYLLNKQTNDKDSDKVVQSTEDTVGTNSVPIAQTTRVLNSDLIPSSSPQKIPADDNDSMDLLDSDVTKRSVYRNLCGSKSFDFEKMLGVSPDNLQFSMEQLNAAEVITRKCRNWFGGINSGRWSDSEQEASENELELYRMMSLLDSSKENITIAQELLTSKDYRIALESAQVLLAYDEEFQKHVANAAGSQTRSYAANAAAEVIPLLSCKLEGGCGSTSISMLVTCLGDSNACGKNMLSYLGIYHSFMYLEDVNAMSEEIYRMITGKG